MCVCFWLTDSVDRLKRVLGGQNWYRSRDINSDTLKSFFSCFPSRHGAERFILNAWIPAGPKRSRVSHSFYILNRATPESMCVSTPMILTRKLKISESVIRKWDIRTFLSWFIPWLMGCQGFLPSCVTICISKTDIGNVQIQPRSVKYDLGR